MTPGSSPDFKETALKFVRALTDRNYSAAYAMMSDEYRQRVKLDQLISEFEEIIPSNWGRMGPIEIGEALKDWRNKQPSDLGWAYVSIGGDMYSEAVTVIVALENGEPKIRELEFGRP